MNALTLFAQNDGGAGAAVGFFGGLMFLWVILALAAFAFWVWMLIDVLVSPMESSEKILWFLVVFFLHVLGALIYFFVARKRGTTVVRTT